MVLALSEAGQRAAGLALAAAVALAVWLAVLAVLALRTRPVLPPAASASSEFGGTEPPAVVSLLVNRWELGREAVPATLLDLVARGALGIDQIAPGRYIVRLPASGAVPPGLTDYEHQVWAHVRSLASDAGLGGPNVAVVPAEALTTGPDLQSEGWWKSFQKAVVADARERGLSRGRWSRWMLVALGVVAVVPAVLAAAAFVAAPTDSSSSSSSSSAEDDDGVGGVLSLAAVAWGGLMAIPFGLRQERDTPDGRAAAARWLGLRNYLDADEAFDESPPTAVAIWDRYLAYGAAMGVAAGAVRALPLGSESDNEAWSSYGGGWHVVRVCYPRRFPPGWGQRPVVAALKAVAVLGGAAFVLIQLGPPVADLVGDVLDEADGWPPWAIGVAAVVAAFLAAAALFVVRAAVMLGFAVSDLFATREVEGMVVRLRGHHLAVDDGRAHKVRAWLVTQPVRLGAAARDTIVRVTVTPRLGYVVRVEPAPASTMP